MPLRHQVFVLRQASLAARHLRRLPVVLLEDAFPGVDGLEIRMRHRFERRGLPHGEAYVLSLVTAHLRPSRVFEIGTGTGGATALMVRQAPNARIDTLDLGEAASSLGRQRGDAPMRDRDAVGHAYRQGSSQGAIVQHFGDSATFDFAPFEAQMDLVLVDGAHTRDYVRNDSRTALSLLAPDGVIIWDDCHLDHPGVSAALVELRASGPAVERIYGTRFALLRTGSRPEVPLPSPGEPA